MTPGGRRAGSGARSPPSWRWGCPLLVAVTVGLVWLLAVGAAQIRVVDGARETARMLARGDAEARRGRPGRAGAPARAAGRGSTGAATRSR